MRVREMARVACRSTRETDGADMMTAAGFKGFLNGERCVLSTERSSRPLPPLLKLQTALTSLPWPELPGTLHKAPYLYQDSTTS